MENRTFAGSDYSWDDAFRLLRFLPYDHPKAQLSGQSTFLAKDPIFHRFDSIQVEGLIEQCIEQQ
jgi:hypothetical protein